MKRTRPAATIALEAMIDELAPGGDGVAIAAIGGERRAIFVPGVSVGDRVKLDVDLARRPARGRVIALLAAGVDRVTPPCPVAEKCGGCDWMHVSTEAQGRAHARHVRSALPPAFRDHPIVAHEAPSPLAYRTRARVHIRASGGRAIVGMNEARTREPVETERCAVLHADVERARVRIAALFEGAHGRGDVQIALGRIPADRAADRLIHRAAVLEVRWSGELAPACFGRLEAALVKGAYPNGSADGWLQGARITYGEATRPAVVGDPTPWMRGADDAPLRLAPGGFGQASDEGNALLAARVAALAPEGQRVTELYAGAGNLTVLLAKTARDIVAVESSREACDAARANLEARALGGKVVEADAASYVISPATQLLVLDPPRTGARDVAERLIASTPSSLKHVLYVSCDPQTLGRDLAILAPRFVPRAIETFDMFPQTSHVETVVLLQRTRPVSGT